MIFMVNKGFFMRADQIIIEPVLTEKANMMKEDGLSKYTFKVHPSVNKLQVMSAVSELFNVKPVGCNIVNMKSKPKSSRTRSGIVAGKSSSWKKAIVTLAKGDKIDAIAVEGV